MSWLVAVCRPSQERRALAALEERGVWAWLPMRPVEFKTRHMRKAAVRHYPLFPGYLLVREREASLLDSGKPVDPHQFIYGVDGIRGVLCNDFRPLRLADAQVENVRRQAETPVRVVRDVWKVGQKIIVDEGPFASFPGIITKASRKDVVSVLLHIFGRSTPVEIEKVQLRKVA